MKVRYQITMEVEVDFDPKTEHLSKLTLELADYATAGFIGRAYTRNNAAVIKVKVSRIGAPEAEAKTEAAFNQAGKAAVKKNRIVRDKIDADAALDRASQMSKLDKEKAGTTFNGFKSLDDKPVNLTTKAPEDYECGCGEMVEKGTELHACRKCQGWQCPNCLDYNNMLCEECISS